MTEVNGEGIIVRSTIKHLDGNKQGKTVELKPCYQSQSQVRNITTSLYYNPNSIVVIIIIIRRTPQWSAGNTSPIDAASCFPSCGV